MNKKIILVFFLLIVMVAITFVYSYFTQSTTKEEHYDYSMGSVDDSDISDEINNLLIDEDYEVEIGEMI
ncbi:MAG: hypothetical protein JSV67_04215 [Thermoplasmatales archaeon]|nr:MAG: hypothetical protein JSV67_04215 [Thermoplasmatales archaeon]